MFFVVVIFVRVNDGATHRNRTSQNLSRNSEVDRPFVRVTVPLIPKLYVLSQIVEKVIKKSRDLRVIGLGVISRPVNPEGYSPRFESNLEVAVTRIS